jgi:hypothetical protein
MKPTRLGGTMCKRRVFSRAVLALATIVFAACSDTPTGPASSPQALPVSVPHALATAAPTIGLSRTRFGLCYPAHFFPASVRGYWCYPYGYLSITNTGGGTLNWTSTKSATWIKRSQTTGTAPSYVKVSVDGTGLPRGTYYGWIKVWATGATNSPQTVSVVMNRY